MNPPQQAGEKDYRIIDRVLPPIPDLVVVFLCLAVWWQPDRFDDSLVASMSLVMILEFLGITSIIVVMIGGAIVAQYLPERIQILAFLVPCVFYVYLAVVFSRALDTWWPTLFFAWQIFSRFGLTLLLKHWNGFSPSFAGEWFMSGVLWFLLVIPAMMLPVPDLPARFDPPWLINAERWLAFAVMYFTGLALFKFFRSPVTDEEVESTGRADLQQERREARQAGQRARPEREARLEARRRK